MIEGMAKNTLLQIIDYFGGVNELWEADENDIRSNIKENYADAIIKSRNPKKIEAYSNKLKEKNISYIYPGHTCYPKSLLDIPDPPLLLYARGDLSLLKCNEEDYISIVGARKASAYGLDMAYSFSKKLALAGMVVVSGLAFGIDGMSHKAAIDAGGRTIGVLGCGINVCYPRENIAIYNKMCTNELVISEYGLDVKPLAYRFPLRNRIISGISRAVLVVEAKEKSGSLITVDQALEQGRDVYVIPGRITDLGSRGCLNLIKQGAVCVTEPEDIISIKKDTFSHSSYNTNINKKKKSLAPNEKMVYSCVRLELKHVDDICAELDIEASEVVNALFALEEKQLIRQVIKNYYVRC